MMKRLGGFRKVLLSVALVAFSLLLFKWDGVSAEEYEKLDYKTVESFDEFWELVESDDVLIKYTKEELTHIDKMWYFDVDEPGWFIFSVYNQNADYDDNSIYLYSNSMLTDKRNYSYTSKSIGGEIYNCRYDYRYWLTKGRYYFKYKNTWDTPRTFGDDVVRLRFYFIPDKIEIQIDKIEYNDDNTVATVYFSTISDNIRHLNLQDKEVKITDDRDSSGSHAIIRLDQYYSSEREQIKQYQADGIELTKNGTYSLSAWFKDDEYTNYGGTTIFTIDKIGAEAAKVQPKSLKMSKTKATLKVDETLTLKVTFKPKNVTEKAVTWKSSNTKVATVDEKGKVTAKKKGTCTITAVSANGKKAKCKITVKK